MSITHDATAVSPPGTPDVYDVSATTYERVREFVETIGARVHFERAGGRVFLVVE